MARTQKKEREPENKMNLKKKEKYILNKKQQHQQLVKLRDKHMSKSMYAHENLFCAVESKNCDSMTHQ